MKLFKSIIMKKFFITIFIFFATINLFAQYYQFANPYIKSYSQKNYTASPQNWAIIQDNRGIMYFGNTSGILEFDGVFWRVIKTSNNSVVRSLAKDSQGTIFVGASGDFGYLSADKKGTLQYVSLINKLEDEHKKFTNVWKTFATSQGIYFCTLDKMFRYYNDTISVIKIKLTPNIGAVINDELFIVQKTGLYLVKGDKLILMPETESFYKNYKEYAVIKYDTNKILFLSSRNGLWIYDYSKTKLTDTMLVKKNNKDTLFRKLECDNLNYFFKNKIYTVEQINENTYAIATNKGGIVIIDKNGHFIKVLNKHSGLPENIVWNVYIDNNKNLWAATNKGVSFIEISSPIRKYDTYSGIDETVYSVAEHNNKIYAGTISKIFFFDKDKIDNVDYNFRFEPLEKSKNSSWDFFKINNELFSIGSHGIEKINETNVESAYSINRIYSFGFMKIFPNLIFIGTRNELVILEIEKNQQVKFIHKQTIDVIKTIRKIASKDNLLWLTTSYSGVVCVEFLNNKISEYKIHKFDTLSGFPSMKYNKVDILNNKLILATEKGIYRSVILNDDVKNTKFISDSSINKAINFKEVEKIIKQKDGIYYLLANGIMGKLSKTKGENTHKWNNIPGRRINSAYLIFPYSKNYIYISTRENGLCLFDTENDKDYNKKYNTIIKKVTTTKDAIIFNGTFYETDSTVFLLHQPDNFIPVLDYKNNSLTFEFSAIFYEASDKIKYKYFLEGFSKDSSEWTTQSNTIFTNSPNTNL